MTHSTLKKAALFSAFFASIALATTVTFAQTPPGKEKCYGISKASEDDGSDASGPVPGMSTSDFQGDAYKYVTTGTCQAIMTPFGAGDLAPIAERPPKE